MKKTTRRILTLLLAALMVCSLMPTALAITSASKYEEDYYEGDDGYTLYLEVDDDLGTGNYYRRGSSESITVTASIENDAGRSVASRYYTIQYVWEGDVDDDDYDDSDGGSYCEAGIDTSKSRCDITCYVKAIPDKSSSSGTSTLYAKITWTGRASSSVYDDDDYDIVVEAAADSTSSYQNGYSFADDDDDGDDSVYQKIKDEAEDYYEVYPQYVRFDNVSDGGDDLLFYNDEKTFTTSQKLYFIGAKTRPSSCKYLDDVGFFPDSKGSEASFTFKLYYTTSSSSTSVSNYLTGIIVFNGSYDGGYSSVSGDMKYAAKKGTEVTIPEEDFEAFWEEHVPGGDLESVRFTGATGGKLYSTYSGSDKNVSSSTCYLSPKNSQEGLSELYFDPTSSSTTTGTVDFTASGKKSSGASTSKSGSIVIYFTSNDVSSIVYSTSGETVSLDSSKFIAEYKDAMNVSSVSSLKIEFLSVPTNGKLYYNYASASSPGKQLTNSNKSQKFASNVSSSSASSIDRLAYVPGNAYQGDTVQYACYDNGGKLRFVGTIAFTVTPPMPMSISKTCDGSGLRLNLTDFFTYSASDDNMSDGVIVFGAPTTGGGKLYTNYANGVGTLVPWGTNRFWKYSTDATYMDISTATFVPTVNGRTVIPFTYTSRLNTNYVRRGTLTVTATLPQIEPLTLPANGTAKRNANSVVLVTPAGNNVVSFDVYTVTLPDGGDVNCFKVRDVALYVNGTRAQFQVGQDASKNIVLTPGTAYTPNGSEMETPFKGNQEFVANTSPVMVNGVGTKLTMITLTDAKGQYNYVRLRDLGAMANFDVYQNAYKQIVIDTTKSYNPNT